MALLLINLVATAFMAGLIWFVQIVHYPLFTAVGRDCFVDYEKAHTRLTTRVVAPAMLVEALTATLLVLLLPPGVASWMAWTGFGMVMMLWLSTAFVQVPEHGRLTRRYDDASQRRLVRTNWLRTALWSGRTALVAWMIWSTTRIA